MKKLLLLAASVVALGGCVSKGRYDEALATNQLTRAELQKKNNELARTNAQLEQSSSELVSRTADVEKLRSEMASRTGEIEKLRGEIDRLVQLDRAHTGEQTTRINELRKRLAELETAQRASEHRAQVYKDLALRLKKQIDGGDLELVIRNGRMVLLLPNDVLFDTGRTELKPAGKTALEAVATVIADMPNRQFQISGHTDNVPIHNAQFASNWELSTGRALRVVHFLAGKGVSEATLSAAGYSEIDPISSNQTPEGRRKNRRTEITLQPNIDEIVQLPE